METIVIPKELRGKVVISEKTFARLQKVKKTVDSNKELKIAMVLNSNLQDYQIIDRLGGVEKVRSHLVGLDQIFDSLSQSVNESGLLNIEPQLNIFYVPNKDEKNISVIGVNRNAHKKWEIELFDINQIVQYRPNCRVILNN